MMKCLRQHGSWGFWSSGRVMVIIGFEQEHQVGGIIVIGL